MFDAVCEQAKADAIPRYAEPTLDELREADFDEILVCENCNWYLACGKAEAHIVVSNINPYSNLGRSSKDKKMVEQAVMRCGICARRTELRACNDQICDDGFEERV